MNRTLTSFKSKETLNLSVFPVWKNSTILAMDWLSCSLDSTLPPAVLDTLLVKFEVGELAISICGGRTTSFADKQQCECHFLSPYLLIINSTL